jgi:16S rRNA (uracil1498-N3)-methyltransferase
MTDTRRRAFVSETPAEGARLDLDPDESHHVARVLRLKTRDALAVFDGKGGEWEATIETATRESVSVVVGRPLTGVVEPELSVVLYQALVRPEKLEWVFQKGSEVGVAAFRLFASHRAEAPPPSPARLARYARILLEACKQSGRRRLPVLSTGALEAPPAGVVAIVLGHAPGVDAIGTVLAGPRAENVWLAVGPEGGFSEGEIDALLRAGWRRASLGPRVLRTETAGAVAAALVLHTWGDLGPKANHP